MQAAKQAPFGRKDETVVDTRVRDCWEIDASGINLNNAAWQTYVQEVIVKNVWQGLGVAEPSTQPKCELYKLLLYETGSHFLPHQDSEKADGMFASVIVVLPSAHTGGQVHVQHGPETAVIDISQESGLCTSILAWYTDVMHEVKPVTSGYRLVLSYNLVHMSPTALPQPLVADAAVSQLRLVLKDWNTYAPHRSKSNLIAYCLKHKYTMANLSDGEKMLKGEDAHMMAHLKPVLDELGFASFFGELEYHLVGAGDEEPYFENPYAEIDEEEEEEEEEEDYNGDGPRKKTKYENDSEAEDQAEEDHLEGIVEIVDWDIKVENMVDLDGNKTDLFGGGIELQDEQLIPRELYKKMEPYESEDSGYTGNEGVTIEHCKRLHTPFKNCTLILVSGYRRTVLVLTPGHCLEKTSIQATGFQHTTSKTVAPVVGQKRKRGVSSVKKDLGVIDLTSD